MSKELAELIRISNAVGKDNLLVQGGGGNTSIKTRDGRYMYIKASGTALKDMSKQKGWRRLKLNSVLAILKDKSIIKRKAFDRENEIVNRLNLSRDDNVKTRSRPSVESHFHALLDRCVVHLHPVAVGAYVSAKDGKKELEKLFKNEKFPPLWIPYTDPGYMLAIKTAGLVESYINRYSRKPAIIFLEKHGIIITGKNAYLTLQLVRRVINICKIKLKEQKGMPTKVVKQENIIDARFAIRRAFFKATGKYVIVRHFIDNDIAEILNKRGAKKLASLSALTPDELVYANGPAVWLERCTYKIVVDKLKRQIARGEKAPLGFLVKGMGLFVAGSKESIRAAKDVITASLLVRGFAANLGGVNPLNRRQRDFINQWEAESFRQKLVSGADNSELQGRIAVVTGAGSGLGKSIAIGLARSGAYVGLIDIDRKAIKETADIIKKELPRSSIMVVLCDVTNERSVDKAFNSIVNQWGGVDILVNAAGIAPAYSLVDLPVRKWRLALEVNLTGYFLMARAAARIMIKQSMAGNIINISSKSGLEASRNNTPYNATKAGEIHIARGWALELGKYGIRVNSIAAGNVFEGSKIWNSKYIKVCAKKYNIKPEEVIPYYVNMTALRREIKGQDVADAVVFLCSEKARTITGQTLVPDSGQVMVR